MEDTAPALPLPADEQDNPNADPDAVKEFWLQTVRPLADRGRLDKLPVHRARTTREKDVARLQNLHLTRRTVGMPKGYERIRWKDITA